MRRSSYYDRADKINYAKTSKGSQVADLNFQNLKLSNTRVPENNFISSRSPASYLQPRNTKSFIHRPYTTQKANSFIDHRSIFNLS